MAHLTGTIKPDAYPETRTGPASSDRGSYNSQNVVSYSRSTEVTRRTAELTAEAAYIQKAGVLYRKAFTLYHVAPTSQATTNALRELQEYATAVAPTDKAQLTMATLIEGIMNCRKINS